MNKTIKRTLLYIGYFVASTLFVLATGFEGGRIETREELANAFPMKTGFPLDFAVLDSPKIDPPLPHNYGGNCCFFSMVSWTNFWLSVLIVFVVLIVIHNLVILLQKKYGSKKFANLS